MQPHLREGRYAFCAPSPGEPIPASAIGWFREAEGDSLILPLEEARARGAAVVVELALITLEVYSAIDAVGLTAAVSSALAADGIACNVVAAVRHDHLFVPAERAADALRILSAL